MARAESKQNLGFYATDPKHHPAILSLVAPATPAHRLLDPFAGEGEFLEVAANQWNVTPYANELDGDRIVADHFRAQDYRKRGHWLDGRCIYPHRHQNGDASPSFSFNTHTGYGFCRRCGSILLKDICTEIGIHPADYGGLFVRR